MLTILKQGLINRAVVTSYISDADTVNSFHYVRIFEMNVKHGRKVYKNEKNGGRTVTKDIC